MIIGFRGYFHTYFALPQYTSEQSVDHYRNSGRNFKNT